MQAMTHFAVGILGYSIYRCADSYLKKANPKDVTAVISHGPSTAAKVVKRLLLLLILSSLVLSHVLLDALAQATYHPPNAMTDNVFWLGFHALVLFVTLFLLWSYRAAIVFMLASVVPDTDWLARPFGLWQEGAAHEYFRNLPGIDSLESALRAALPDWRWVELAALNELALLACVMIFASFFVRMPTENKLNDKG